MSETHFTCSGVHDLLVDSELHALAESKILSGLSVIFGDYPAKYFSVFDWSLRFRFEFRIESGYTPTGC
jgi:hypothetical protein